MLVCSQTPLLHEGEEGSGEYPDKPCTTKSDHNKVLPVN